jgi:hypothetical protein
MKENMFLCKRHKLDFVYRTCVVCAVQRLLWRIQKQMAHSRAHGMERPSVLLCNIDQSLIKIFESVGRTLALSK